MAIIIRTKARATAQNPNPKQHYFSFPDDTLMDLATQAIYKRFGVHRQYEFCEEREVPKGVTIVVISRAEVTPGLTSAPAASVAADHALHGQAPAIAALAAQGGK